MRTEEGEISTLENIKPPHFHLISLINFIPAHIPNQKSPFCQRIYLHLVDSAIKMRLKGKIMKIVLLLIISVSAHFSCFLQINLVPNNSFETFSICPLIPGAPNYSGVNAICLASPWFQPLNPNATPSDFGCGESSSDFWHSCSGNVPLTGGGSDFQYPKTGDGFVGIGLFYPINPEESRESMEVPLKEALKRKQYCVSWSANLAGISGRGANGVGAYFSQDTVFQTGFWERIPVTPQIENLAIVTDTQNWIPFHQSFLAQGGERFMTISNFREGDLIQSIIVDTTLLWPYYYFDDFGVYELPEISAGLGGEIDTLGESVALQANCEGCWNDLVYRWWPSAGLSDTTVLNPVATPEVTTTYYFGLIDTSETVPCIVDLVDSVTVFVNIPEDTIMPPPTSFSWLVFPSPTTGNLSLQFSGITETTSLQLIDERGRLIRRYDIPKDTQSFPLDLSPFAAGEYFLRLENSTLIEKRKVTKM